MTALQVWQHRAPLKHICAALAKGRATVGFIGTSITDERPGHNWPESVMAWLVERFPCVRFCVENAAIGGTASDLAVLRADGDIVARGCDLVFVEYAVNDPGMPTERRLRAREGLLRKLLGPGTMDVVLAYTFEQAMYDDMMNDRVPYSIQEFEDLGAHYGISSVWMGLYALQEVRQGRMRWEEWLPDGLHPTHRGSLSYGQSVTQFLERELEGVPVADGRRATGNQQATAAGDQVTVRAALARPLHARHWGQAKLLPLTDVHWQGPWTLRRSTTSTWVDQFLQTSAVGATMQFSFTGNAVTLVFDFGKASAEFNYRIDGGDWTLAERDRPDWCGDSGWLLPYTLAEDLPSGEHTVEIEVTHGNRPECRGTRFTLAMIGIVAFEE